MITSADLTLYELHAVIHKPADRRTGKSGRGSILFCPVHHTLGSIHVSNGSTGCSCGQSSAAGIGKKIQHLDRTTGISDLLTKPVPVHSLLRKKSCMLEAERLQIKGKILVMDIPLMRQIKELPLTASAAASVIMAVHMLPATVLTRSIPDNLWVRTNKEIIPPAFQLLSFRCINNLVIFPTICNPHDV